MEHTDEDGNVYVLIPEVPYQKGDPTCRGCAVRAASMIPGGKFCLSLNSGKHSCHIPFNKHIWYQVKWGAYPKEPRLKPPTPGDAWYKSFLA